VTNESTLGALGKGLSNPLPKTLGGLGPRQRVKTGPGLGPLGSTLVSAADSARRAREISNDELGLPLVDAASPSAPVQPKLSAEDIAQLFGRLPGATPAPPAPAVRPTAPAPREESVAFALGDADFIELESAPVQQPPSARGLPVYGAPASPAQSLDAEDALPLPELPDEEITHVAISAPSASQPTASTPERSVSLAEPTAALLGTHTTPPPPSYGSRESSRPARGFAPPPLLIDVTPLTLAVETVNGFCDPVIERNTQVPCERTRVFVTAVDRQSLVRVRISQGESSHFSQNTLLGEVELSNLTLAPRGEVQIAVSFSLDTNGMLNVSAKEVATGRATTTQVRLVALPDANDIHWMAQRNAAQRI